MGLVYFPRPSPPDVNYPTPPPGRVGCGRRAGDFYSEDVVPDRILKELERTTPRFHSGLAAGLHDPTVTFVCPTYGTAALKPHLLNEAVYWYLRQTYPHRELLILNDAPGQTLVCKDILAAQGVRIVNWPYRIRTLGEKYNLMVLLAAGSVIIPQEDDDVSLPWRAEQAVSMLSDYPYWTPGLWWYYEFGSGAMRADGNGYGHNCSAYRRAEFYNRYEKTTGDQDARIHRWAEANLTVNPTRLTDPKDISYVYRWGVSGRHLSGYGAGKMQAAYDAMTAGPDGEYEVKGEAGVDWVNAAAGACQWQK